MKQKTVIVVGAGASRNSWDAVVSGLKDVITDLEVNKENANFIFANLIQQIRWVHYAKDHHEKVKNDNELKLKLENKCNEHLKLLEEIKKSIAKRLKKATADNVIHLDKVILERIGNELIRGNQVTVITTNWDKLFTNYFENANICFLHGSVDDPKYMYLPTEAIEEAYRSQDERDFLGRLAGQCMNEIEKADQIILYGLSFSPLDAELGIVWSEGCHGRKSIPEVYLVDPYPELILKNLKYLTPNLNVKVALEGAFKK